MAFNETEGFMSMFCILMFDKSFHKSSPQMPNLLKKRLYQTPLSDFRKDLTDILIYE